MTEQERMSGWRKAWRLVLPVLVLVVAAGLAKWLILTGPKPRKRPPREQSVVVRVTSLRRTNAVVRLAANGVVTAAQRVQLQSRVPGEVIEMDPRLLPGGTFAAGEPLLRLDPEDYELAVARLRADVAKAEQGLQVERGLQDLARHEWELLPDRESMSELDRELTLRVPQLRAAREALEAARAALRQAELNVARTTVRAPFNAVVVERRVDVGAQVSAQTVLADLAGTDAYWVVASLPADRLPWVRLPEPDGTGGSPATIRPAAGVDVDAAWQGRVIRQAPDVEPAGRLARLIISVPAPLDGPDGERLRLLLGAYVRATIEGRRVENVFAIPRSALHDGQYVWIMNGKGRLDIRAVRTVWKDRETALISEGVREGERLVVSALTAPVPGLRLVDAESEAAATDDARGQPETSGGTYRGRRDE
jgi:RND family efflux transporter MFP subunit